MSQSENFFRRWSRMKTQSSGAGVGLVQPLSALPQPGPVDDLSALFQPDVSRQVRQQALRGLFMTDHYRVMDGLDVYVGDYSNPELLSAEMLETIDHARSLLNRDAPDSIEKDVAVAPVVKKEEVAP